MSSDRLGTPGEGLRRGEAGGLRWCDVDLDDGVAVITQQLQQYDGHMVTCPPKTSHSARVIALDHTTVAALRRHRLRQQAEQRQPGHRDSGYVFTGLGGDPLAPDRLTRHFCALPRPPGCPRSGSTTCATAPPPSLKWAELHRMHHSPDPVKARYLRCSVPPCSELGATRARAPRMTWDATIRLHQTGR